VCESVKASGDAEFKRSRLYTGRRRWTPSVFTCVAVNATRTQFVAKLLNVLHAHPELLAMKLVVARVEVHISVKSAAYPAESRANDWLSFMFGDSIKISR
jgi:hypothetical protein